jgi:hypothetical protein
MIMTVHVCKYREANDYCRWFSIQCDLHNPLCKRIEAGLHRQERQHRRRLGLSILRGRH